jgi:hypothetical protein
MLRCHIIRLESKFKFKFKTSMQTQEEVVTSVMNIRCVCFDFYNYLLGYVSLLWCMYSVSSEKSVSRTAVVQQLQS